MPGNQPHDRQKHPFMPYAELAVLPLSPIAVASSYETWWRVVPSQYK